MVNIILSTGGTGGHVFPAQVFMEALDQRFQPHLICDNRGAKFISKNLSNVNILKFSGNSNTILGKISRLYSYLYNIIRTFFYLIKHKPKLVVIFGGYTTLPTAISALILRIPIVLHEQNFVIGRTNKLFLKFAKAITTNFQNVKGIGAKYKDKQHYVGLILRKELVDIKRKDLSHLKPFKILVLGGSQGASILTDTIPKACMLLPANLQKKLSITHQVRNKLLESTEEYYKRSKVPKYKIDVFFKDIPELLTSSHLVICRSGASTVSELAWAKVPSILVPLAIAKDDHQYINASFLAEKRAGLILTEDNFTPERLAKALSKMLESGLYRFMLSNAKRKLNLHAVDSKKLNEMLYNLALK